MKNNSVFLNLRRKIQRLRINGMLTRHLRPALLLFAEAVVCMTLKLPKRYRFSTPNETVEKPLVRKMSIKISHNRLKNCQNVAKMLCGTPKTRHFSAFLSHFSKIIFEKRLIRQSQRSALPAWGGSVDSPSKRGKAQSQNNAQKTRRVPTVSCTL